MTDLTNLPRKSIPKYVISVLDNIDSFDIDYDGNYAALLSLSATACLVNFITVAQLYCKKNHLILDEDFINEKIGDLNFVRKLFNDYESDGGEEKDKLRYLDLSLLQHKPEESHKIITDVIKRAFQNGQNGKVSESVLHEKVIDHIKSIMSNLTIDEVTFDRDVDHDGDPIIRINAFYSKRDDKDMAKNTAKAVQDVRDILDDSGDESFPVIRYISIDEWDK